MYVCTYECLCCTFCEVAIEMSCLCSDSVFALARLATLSLGCPAACQTVSTVV